MCTFACGVPHAFSFTPPLLPLRGDAAWGLGFGAMQEDGSSVFVFNYDTAAQKQKYISRQPTSLPGNPPLPSHPPFLPSNFSVAASAAVWNALSFLAPLWIVCMMCFCSGTAVARDITIDPRIRGCGNLASVPFLATFDALLAETAKRAVFTHVKRFQITVSLFISIRITRHRIIVFVTRFSFQLRLAERERDLECVKTLVEEIGHQKQGVHALRAFQLAHIEYAPPNCPHAVVSTPLNSLIVSLLLVLGVDIRGNKSHVSALLVQHNRQKQMFETLVVDLDQQVEQVLLRISWISLSYILL